MKNTILFIMAVISLLFGSCQRNVYFNDFEKSLLDIYQEGDTLIFESEKGVRDTSYILRKDIGYARWNPYAHAGRYKFLSGEIYYTRNWLGNGKPDLREYFSLSKSHPDTTRLFIAYRGIVMFEKFPELSEQSLSRFRIDTNLYRFRISRIDKDKRTEKQLYWHLEHGLIKFVTAEGEVWRRVNTEVME